MTTMELYAASLGNGRGRLFHIDRMYALRIHKKPATARLTATGSP
jgi:hypothetical protein